jgi:outer membrane lipoprotein carrier protein
MGRTRPYDIISPMKPAVVLISALVCLVTAGSPADESLQQAVVRLEARLKSLTSLQADFEQLLYSQTVSEPLRGRGAFTFRKPDLMKWQYASPEPQVFLFRDGVFSFYIPSEKQLIRSRSAGERYESEILALFSGARGLREDYDVEAAEFPSGSGAGRQLKLVPRREGEYTHILIEVDPASGLIGRAIFFDWAGNKTEFRFSKLRPDRRLPRDAFDLVLPPGVEVIDEADVIKG